MNCSLTIAKYINLHLLNIVQFKKSSKIQELLKSNMYIKSYQENMIEFWKNVILIRITFEFQV